MGRALRTRRARAGKTSGVPWGKYIIGLGIGRRGSSNHGVWHGLIDPFLKKRCWWGKKNKHTPLAVPTIIIIHQLIIHKQIADRISRR
jgi:hypothetical protein